MATWNGEELPDCVSLLCHHLIGLTWYEGTARADGQFSGKPVWQAASGFLVELVGGIYFISAGHVFKTVAKRKSKDPRFKIDMVRIWDSWSPLAKNLEGECIPYDIFDDDITSLQMVELDSGVDVALLPVSTYLGQFLSKTIVPFGREDWLNSDLPEYKVYYLVGTPGCLADEVVERTGSQKSVTTYHRPTIVAVEPTSESGLVEPVNRQFVARIHPSYDLKSIVGMSGGVILGFRHDKDGNFRYWPVAIQSRWLPDSRIIIGTYLAPFLKEYETVHSEIHGEATADE